MLQIKGRKFSTTRYRYRVNSRRENQRALLKAEMLGSCQRTVNTLQKGVCKVKTMKTVRLLRLTTDWTFAKGRIAAIGEMEQWTQLVWLPSVQKHTMAYLCVIVEWKFKNQKSLSMAHTWQLLMADTLCLSTLMTQYSVIFHSQHHILFHCKLDSKLVMSRNQHLKRN